MDRRFNYSSDRPFVDVPSRPLVFARKTHLLASACRVWLLTPTSMNGGTFPSSVWLIIWYRCFSYFLLSKISITDIKWSQRFIKKRKMSEIPHSPNSWIGTSRKGKRMIPFVPFYNLLAVTWVKIASTPILMVAKWLKLISRTLLDSSARLSVVAQCLSRS